MQAEKGLEFAVSRGRSADHRHARRILHILLCSRTLTPQKYIKYKSGSLLQKILYILIEDNREKI